MDRSPSPRLSHFLPILLVLLASACLGGTELGPARGRGGSARSAGIALTPPPGVGERALRCEADHAPLRRLNHREYQRTLRDLFPGLALPELMVIADGRREGFLNNVE